MISEDSLEHISFKEVCAMAKTKIALLYERLSRDGELQGESFSIQNPNARLEDYAQRHGFPRFRHYTDDGVSGTRFAGVR